MQDPEYYGLVLSFSIVLYYVFHYISQVARLNSKPELILEGKDATETSSRFIVVGPTRSLIQTFST